MRQPDWGFIAWLVGVALVFVIMANSVAWCQAREEGTGYLRGEAVR